MHAARKVTESILCRKQLTPSSCKKGKGYQNRVTSLFEPQEFFYLRTSKPASWSLVEAFLESEIPLRSGSFARGRCRRGRSEMPFLQYNSSRLPCPLPLPSSIKFSHGRRVRNCPLWEFVFRCQPTNHTYQQTSLSIWRWYSVDCALSVAR